MYIRLLAIGNKMPDWVTAGFSEYAKRFPPTCSLELVEIPAEKRTKDANVLRINEREGERLLNAIKPGNRVIALDVKGKMWSTEQLADHLKQWQLDSRSVDLLIGGPDGLSEACLQKAETRW